MQLQTGSAPATARMFACQWHARSTGLSARRAGRRLTAIGIVLGTVPPSGCFLVAAGAGAGGGINLMSRGEQSVVTDYGPVLEKIIELAARS